MIERVRGPLVVLSKANLSLLDLSNFLDFQTILYSFSFSCHSFSCQNYQMQIFPISSLGAALSLIRDSFWDVKNPARDRILFSFGTHLFPSVILVWHAHWRMTLMCFFLAKRLQLSFLHILYSIYIICFLHFLKHYYRLL